MADTIADLVVPFDDWLDVSVETSISTGTALVVQNKSGIGVIYAISATKPAASLTSGPVAAPYPSILSIANIDAGENKVWLRAFSSEQVALVNVQEG